MTNAKTAGHKLPQRFVAVADGRFKSGPYVVNRPTEAGGPGRCGLTERPGDIGQHAYRSPRITGAIKMLVRKIEYEESKQDCHCDSHDGIIVVIV
jgi:hypothetical protein